MTKEEFYEEYAGVPVKFKKYYNYIFTFEGETADGKVVQGCVGGESEAIKGLKIKEGEWISLSLLDPKSVIIKENGAITGVFHLGDKYE